MRESSKDTFPDPPFIGFQRNLEITRLSTIWSKTTQENQQDVEPINENNLDNHLCIILIFIFT